MPLYIHTLYALWDSVFFFVFFFCGGRGRGGGEVGVKHVTRAAILLNIEKDLFYRKGLSSTVKDFMNIIFQFTYGY